MSIRGSEAHIRSRSDISTKGQKANVRCQRDTLLLKLASKPPPPVTARAAAENCFLLDGNRRLRESIPSAPGRREGITEVIESVTNCDLRVRLRGELTLDSSVTPLHIDSA